MPPSTVLSRDNPWTFCSLSELLAQRTLWISPLLLTLSHQACKYSRVFQPQTNQSKTKQTPPFCVLLALLLLTTKLLQRALSIRYLYFLTSHSLLNPAQSGFFPTTPLKLLLQEVLYLSSKDWKCCAGTGRPLLLATASSGPGAREELNTLLLVLLGHLLQWPLMNCLLLHLPLGFYNPSSGAPPSKLGNTEVQLR